MNFEATNVEREVVGGLEFEKFTVKIKSDADQLILNQIFYSRLINGLDMGVNLNYTKDEFGRELLDAWRASTFSNTN